MKYLPLIWAGLWRKRVRTILTMLSVAVAETTMSPVATVPPAGGAVIDTVGAVVSGVTFVTVIGAEMV